MGCKKTFVASAGFLLCNLPIIAHTKDISLQLSSERTYWAMEEIDGTRHNTDPFEAQSISGTIYGVDVNYGKNSNGYEETSFEELFVRVPTLRFDSSTVKTFFELQTFGSELFFDEDFFLYENGTVEELPAGTSMEQTVEVKELGLHWSGNQFYSNWKPAAKLSYKEYIRPANLTIENYIANTTYSAYMIGLEMIYEKPTEGWGFYTQGFSIASGEGELAAQEEELSDAIEEGQSIEYIEMSIEPRFIIYIVEDFALDLGYLYKRTKFSVVNDSSGGSLGLALDTFQSFDVKLHFNF